MKPLRRSPKSPRFSTPLKGFVFFAFIKECWLRGIESNNLLPVYGTGELPVLYTRNACARSPSVPTSTLSFCTQGEEGMKDGRATELWYFTVFPPASRSILCVGGQSPLVYRRQCERAHGLSPSSPQSLYRGLGTLGRAFGAFGSSLQF